MWVAQGARGSSDEEFEFEQGETEMAVETRARVTKGKAKGIDACADDRGIIRAAAMDQRGSLMRQIGPQGAQAPPASLTELKTAAAKAPPPDAHPIPTD